MPSRNILKAMAPDAYYHAYARGASRQPVFLEDADYAYFLSLLERYLSSKQAVSKTGVPYPNFHGRIELIAYCLMGNHFHLLVWQDDAKAMTDFMRSVMTSYSRYFNLKYKRSGTLFESRYKASRVDQEQYLQHISRYIHMNPRYWQRYPYSSLSYYFNEHPDWLAPGAIERMFPHRSAYIQFLKDYEEQKTVLEELKQNLADN